MPSLHSRLFYRIISKNLDVYFLKLVTLTIAFACSTIIILFSLYEFGYDRFNKDANSVFRILKRNNSESYTGNRLSNKISDDIQAVVQSFNADSIAISRLKPMNKLNVLAANKLYRNERIVCVDATIQNVFTFHILKGSREALLNRHAAISSSSAQKWFDSNDVIGKSISVFSYGDTTHISIGAVYADIPSNTHESFDILVPFNSEQIELLGFNPGETGMYGRVLQGDISYYADAVNKSIPSDTYSVRFQPLPEIYFGPRVIDEDTRHGDHYSILIIISISILILFLALTNFINLTTLALPHRSKELAIKKLSGTNQQDLNISFLKESFALVIVSFILGLSLLGLAAPYLESILLVNWKAFITNYFSLIVFVSLLLFVSAVAPLFVIIKFTKATPTRLLSTETITFPKFKRIITFLQLGISAFLIVASMVIRRQVNYSLIKEPGRNYDQVVYIPYPKDLTREGLAFLRSTWKQFNPNIVDVMATSQLPTELNSKELDSDSYTLSVDPGFKDFFDLKVIDGNWFKANDGDTIIVVNEIGKGKLKSIKNVIGVISNLGAQFNLPEKPLKMTLAPSYDYSFLCIRVLEVEIRRTVKYLGATFHTNGEPAKVSFLNKRFEAWLSYQDRLNGLSKILTAISALLACCAIYGLTVSLVREKMKQIAIHKLFGASSLHITYLLIKEFARQLIIAVLIFGPLTYIVVKELLRSFVYSTHFNWLDPVYPLAFCVIIIVTLCAFQASNLNRADLSSALKG